MADKRRKCSQFMSQAELILKLSMKIISVHREHILAKIEVRNLFVILLHR